MTMRPSVPPIGITQRSRTSTERQPRSAAPPKLKNHSQLFPGLLLLAERFNIPAKRIRTPSQRVIASESAAAIDCVQRNRFWEGVKYGANSQFAWRSGNRG